MPAALRAALLLVSLLPAMAGAATFGFDDVVTRASALAAKSYKAPDKNLPAALNKLTYDQYRDIRFRPDHALWRNSKLPFEVQFLHPGSYFDHSVRINLVSASGVRPIRYRSTDFDYGHSGLDPRQLGDPGFSGFRVHYPINNPDYKDEVLVFQGASYFRALGKGQRYGLSARGLAIDTGELSGEEFPMFTEFWIVWPRPQDNELTIYALMDSPRATGAYRFQLKPGDDTQMEVSVRLFFRDAIGKLGMAPLTSMYLFGENQRGPSDDYRPEVHDSDGLMVHTDNEWIWRPLVNPRRLLITAFGAVNPRGFGLMQRDHDFVHYEDLESRYDLRPSAWVEPDGDWGKGRVELVAIPSPDETNDNIVAYWVPDKPVAAGDERAYAYTLRWAMNPEILPPLAHVVQTRSGHGWQRKPDDTLHFHVDFAGGALDDWPADAKLEADVWANDNGKLQAHQLYRNEVTGGWRLSLHADRVDDTKPLELRAVLRDDQHKPVSETWAYVVPASSGR